MTRSAHCNGDACRAFIQPKKRAARRPAEACSCLCVGCSSIASLVRAPETTTPDGLASYAASWRGPSAVSRAAWRGGSPPLRPTNTSKWRNACAVVIARVLEQTKDCAEPTRRRALREAYPFGQKKLWPYRVWLSEIAIQTGRKPPLGARRGRKVDPRQLSFLPPDTTR